MVFSAHLLPKIATVALFLNICSGQFFANDIVSVPLGIEAEDLNILIADASKDAEVQFASGIYRFDAPIVIMRNDLKLVGQADGSTKFHFAVLKNDGQDFINIGARGFGADVALKNVSNRNDKFTHTQSLSKIQAGDTVHIQTPNTREYIRKGGWKNVSYAIAKSRSFREFIVQIVRVDGKRITLAKSLPYDLPQGSTLKKLNVSNNVTLRNLTITNGLGETDPTRFENTLPSYHSKAVIRAHQTVGLRLENIFIKNPPSKGITLDRSISAHLRDIRIEGAHNKGAGGNGYGIELREAFHNKLEGLKINNTRHAFQFSSWHAETHNQVRIKETNRDINFHGSPDHSNVIEVDRMNLSYLPKDPSNPHTKAWSAISAGGYQHARTNFVSTNKISLRFALASWRDDILIAHSDGSRLNGAIGADILIGSNGNDTMIGGQGADTFVVGHGNDTIEDFSPGRDAILILRKHKLPNMEVKNVPSGTRLILGRGVAEVFVVGHSWPDIRDSVKLISDTQLREVTRQAICKEFAPCY